MSTVGGRKFSKELIELGKNYYKKVIVGNWEPASIIKNRDVLIIGPSHSVAKYKFKIIKYIKKNKPIVFVLNAIDPLPKKYVYANVACHALRLLYNINKYKR